MIISTLRFGNLEIPEDKVITMIKPVLGFEQLKEFCIIEREDCEPFLWFQAIKDPSVAFLIINPIVFDADYNVEVNPKELGEIKISDLKKVETYVIVNVPSDPDKMSLNMQGPIIINTENRKAKQLVLVNSNYKVKHYVLSQNKPSVVKETEQAVEPATV